MKPCARWLAPLTTLLAQSSLCLAEPATDENNGPIPQYKFGDPIPVSCLNRSIETGEHMADAEGRLQYVPFPTCNETGRPLELYFGVEREINCTIDFISDPFFHLLEFYIHNDAPLTCRIPSRPLTPTRYTDPTTLQGVMGSESTAFIPLIVALSGILQLSHLHIANNLNVLLHAAPRRTAPGVVDAATAYSVSPATRNLRVAIGDALPLMFSVRWYPNAGLPSGWQGVGGHLTFSTLVYCLLSAGASAAVCIVYFRGVDLPRRLKRHGRDRVGLLGIGSGAGANGAQRSGGGYGYGYGVGGSGGGGPMGNGVGAGWGYSGTGKID
ncbi:MAG: hypothetical protein M1828_004732 [Chrysothrix sp. TS-e1954]|nr:MAG: hypothetical protein M1828_004732 [Chrysothrix sp. TS-e1954]